MWFTCLVDFPPQSPLFFGEGLEGGGIFLPYDGVTLHYTSGCLLSFHALTCLGVEKVEKVILIPDEGVSRLGLILVAN